MNDKYFEVDKQITREIKEKLITEGITSYPAKCETCNGSGNNSFCVQCKGKGFYELAIELVNA